MRTTFLIAPAIAGLCIAACSSSPSSVKGKQLDFIVANKTGSGGKVIDNVTLPYGRYTVFTSADPEPCLQEVQVHNGSTRVAASNDPRGLVQRELQSDTYHLVIITASSACTWQVQVVLNSMLTDDSPPPRVHASEPRDRGIALFSSGTSQTRFHLSDTGIYEVAWHTSSPPGTPLCPWSLELTADDGHTNHIAATSGSPAPHSGSSGGDEPHFLAGGDWTLSMGNTRCQWVAAISPWFGRLGGGAEGFNAGSG